MNLKTKLLAALLGTLGAVAAMAQTNVYSLGSSSYLPNALPAPAPLTLART